MSVADFEIAAQQAALSGTATTVPFDCEPTELLGALRRGERPPEPVPGRYLVRVEP